MEEINDRLAGLSPEKRRLEAVLRQKMAAELPVAVHQQPGDHGTILREPAVEGLASRLHAHLEDAEQVRLPSQDLHFMEGRN